MEFWDTNYSHWSNLTILNASINYSGTFECVAESQTHESAKLISYLEVRPIRAPIIHEHSAFNNGLNIELGHNFSLKCGSKVTGDPEPVIGN